MTKEQMVAHLNKVKFRGHDSWFIGFFPIYGELENRYYITNAGKYNMSADMTPLDMVEELLKVASDA